MRIDQRVNRRLVHHVQLLRGDIGHTGIAFKQLFIHVGSEHLRALRSHGQHAGTANALPGGCNECCFAFESHGCVPLYGWVCRRMN